MGSVSNQPFREAFEASGRSAGDLARELGYMRRQYGKQCYDHAPVLRALGLKKEAPSRGGRLFSHMREQTALRYAEALDLDPLDLGF